MSHRWIKLGHIYQPEQKGRHEKLLTHAANPLPVHLDGNIYRVFYNGRDHRNRSSVGAVDIDIAHCKVIHTHHAPFFEYGPTASFFADGVSIGNCYKVGDIRYMSFMGWRNPVGEHWRGVIGRLIVTPELTLEFTDNEPLMDSNPIDPLSLSYPWIYSSNEGFDMWYGSTLTWDAGNGEMLHVIHHASSLDGDHWRRHGCVVPFELGRAQAFSRPTVVADGHGGLDMWFSYRGGGGEPYRIGYAHSVDGRAWTLMLEQAGISVSDGGWDSAMIEYPYVFDHDGRRYMLYNGNGYGKSGFGMAVLDNG